jgi:hypothetical protein
MEIPDTDLEATGLTFYLVTAGSEGDSGVVTLRAAVPNQKVWDAVINRFADGHHIYAQPGLVQEAVELLEERAKGLRSASREAQTRHHRELEQLRSENSLLHSQVKVLRETNVELATYAKAMERALNIPSELNIVAPSVVK